MNMMGSGSWVQVERTALLDLSNLIDAHPMAVKLVAVFMALMGDHNAIVVSQKNLARMLGGVSERTVRRAVAALRELNYIDVRQIGDRGTVNAYILNDRVAWQGSRDKLRYSRFTAEVLVTADEQPDQADIGKQPPLLKVSQLKSMIAHVGQGGGDPTQRGRQLTIEDWLNHN